MYTGDVDDLRPPAQQPPISETGQRNAVETGQNEDGLISPSGGRRGATGEGMSSS